MCHHPTPESDAGQPNPVLSTALAYYALGWSIIPVKPRSKLPAVPWKRYQTGRATSGTVRRWFKSPTGRNLAVICGPVSNGLCVRDFDVVDAYNGWASENPSLAKSLPTVITGRGFHVYFIADPPVGRIVHTEDGELRGAGYCLLPPSIHPDGPAYRWRIPFDGKLPKLSPSLFLPRTCASVTESTEENGRVQRVTEGIQRETEAIKGRSAASCERSISAKIEKAIIDTLPAGPGKRHRQVFELARAIQGIPEVAGCDPTELESIVRRWHSLALPHIRTEPFEETYIDFLRAWPNVRIPKGATMAAILDTAKRRPPPKAAERFEQPKLRLLVSLCRELQRHEGDQPFFLSCRLAGELIGADHMTANRWLFLLEARGVLQVIAKGDTRRATRYRYLPLSEHGGN